MNDFKVKFADGTEHKQRWLRSSDSAQKVLEDNRNGGCAYCLCCEADLKLSIKRRNKLFLAAYPRTKSLHHPNCVHYGETASELTAHDKLTKDAKKEVHGRYYISCDVSLTHRDTDENEKDADNEDPKAPDESKSKKTTSARKISLLSVLYDFWCGSQLNQWTEVFSGKRYWGTVRNRLIEYTSNIYINKVPMSSALYIPEYFVKEKMDDIVSRRNSFFSKWKGFGNRDFLVIGELRDIEPSEHGFVLKLKHDSTPYYMSEEIDQSMASGYKHEMSVYAGNQKTPPTDNKVIVIMTCSIPSVYTTIRNISLLAVNNEYLPFQTEYELKMLSKLVSENRTFIKPPKPRLTDHGVADGVLLDTEKETILSIFDDNQSEYDMYVGEKEVALESMDYETWKWYTHEQDDPPSFPEASVEY